MTDRLTYGYFIVYGEHRPEHIDAKIISVKFGSYLFDVSLTSDGSGAYIVTNERQTP
jgi:hypothetical protein